MTQNQIAYHNLKETQRSNLEKERETRQHNRAQEEIGREGNRLTEKRDNQTYMYNMGNLEESTRSHKVAEAENERSHRANENLTSFSNATARMHLSIDQQNADSNTRNASTNAWNAAINEFAAKEKKRDNLINESIAARNLQETERSHKENENIQRFANVTNYATKAQGNVNTANYNDAVNQHYVRQDAEQKRKDLVDEYIDSLRLQHDVENDTAKLQQGYIVNMKPNVSIRGGINYGSK